MHSMNKKIIYIVDDIRYQTVRIAKKYKFYNTQNTQYSAAHQSWRKPIAAFPYFGIIILLTICSSTIQKRHYCVAMATKVTQTQHTVTLYIHCLACCTIILIFSYDKNLNFQSAFNLCLYMDKQICLSFLKYQIKKKNLNHMQHAHPTLFLINKIHTVHMTQAYANSKDMKMCRTWE